MTELLTTEELCRKLKTSRRSLERLRKRGMPCIMLGRAPRFDYDAVLQWLKQQQEAQDVVDYEF